MLEKNNNVHNLPNEKNIPIDSALLCYSAAVISLAANVIYARKIFASPTKVFSKNFAVLLDK